MRKKIKNKIKFFLKPIADKFGFMLKSEAYQLMKKENHKSKLLEHFFTSVKQLGFMPNHIVDVGANRGGWTREVLKVFPGSKISMFEPQEQMRTSVEDLLTVNKNITFYPYGVGSRTGTFKFTIVDRDDSCNFRLTEEEAKRKNFKQIDLPVINLNEFVEEKQLPIPDLIKIDAEGLDLEVLEGANNFFGKTEVVMVEAAVVCKRIDNTFKSVIDYMDDNGYVLFDITDLNRPHKVKVLWLVELVFVKKGGLLDKSKIFDD